MRAFSDLGHVLIRQTHVDSVRAVVVLVEFNDGIGRLFLGQRHDLAPRVGRRVEHVLIVLRLLLLLLRNRIVDLDVLQRLVLLLVLADHV